MNNWSWRSLSNKASWTSDSVTPNFFEWQDRSLSLSLSRSPIARLHCTSHTSWIASRSMIFVPSSHVLGKRYSGRLTLNHSCSLDKCNTWIRQTWIDNYRISFIVARRTGSTVSIRWRRFTTDGLRYSGMGKIPARMRRVFSLPFVHSDNVSTYSRHRLVESSEQKRWSDTHSGFFWKEFERYHHRTATEEIEVDQRRST